MILLLLLLLAMWCKNDSLLLRSLSILSTEYWSVLWIGLRLTRAFLWFSLLLKLPFADAACGDICNDGDEAVWGDVSDVISPVIEKKKKRVEIILNLMHLLLKIVENGNDDDLN